VVVDSKGIPLAFEVGTATSRKRKREREIQMQGTNRLTNILLMILIVSVWALVWRGMAQTAPGAAATKKELVVCAIDEQGKYRFDGGGDSLGLTATGLVNALEEAARQNVTIHSIITPSNGGGYVIIVEK
jgi:hypothetical protein